MSRPYSIDLRERVIAAATEGLSVRTVGEIFDVSPSFVSKLGVGGGDNPRINGAALLRLGG